MSKTKTRPVTDLAKDWMKDPVFRAEYEALGDEFALAEALIDARAQSDLTQEEIAARMGTSRTAVARLESGKGNPSLKTLQRYAEAVGSRLKITLQPAPPPAE